MKILILILIFTVNLTFGQVFTVYPNLKGYLAIDSVNNIWAEASGIIRKFDGTSWSTISYPTCLKPYTGLAVEYAIDKSSYIWTSTSDTIYGYNQLTNDCKKYRWRNSEWTTYNERIVKILCDKNNKMWFAMSVVMGSYYGTSILALENDSVIIKASYWPAYYQSMGADNSGNIWLSVNNEYSSQYEVYKFNNISNTLQNTNGCMYGSLNMVTDTLNNIWMGTNYFNGVNCVGNLSNTCLNDLWPYTIWSLAIDHNNVKWFGTSKGLIRFDGVNCTVYDTTNSDIPEMNVAYFVIDKYNNLWFNSNDAGAGKFNIVKACGLIDTCLTVVSPKLQEPSPKLQIYPNPTGNNIKISIPAGYKESVVSIYNISGKEVLREQYKSNEIEINTENFPKGVYLIKISSEGTVYNEKLIIN